MKSDENPKSKRNDKKISSKKPPFNEKGVKNKSQVIDSIPIVIWKTELKSIVDRCNVLSDPKNWSPLDDNDQNFGPIKAQQDKPVNALIEKVTNSIDAILIKKCREMGIKPTDIEKAPKSINDAVELFFGNECKNWLETTHQKVGAQDVQIIADGKDTKDTSIIIYDNGVGQHPKNFKSTFLSIFSASKFVFIK